MKEGVKQPMEKAPRPEAPSIEQIKLPDKYKLLAVPKNEGAILQDTSIVQLADRPPRRRSRSRRIRMATR